MVTTAPEAQPTISAFGPKGAIPTMGAAVGPAPRRAGQISDRTCAPPSSASLTVRPGTGDRSDATPTAPLEVTKATRPSSSSSKRFDVDGLEPTPAQAKELRSVSPGATRELSTVRPDRST